MTRRRLGEAIQRRMDELGISGNQLAERVPYDPGGMSRIIAGTRGCRPETAAAIDRALGAGGEIAEAAAADTQAIAASAEVARTRLMLDDALARGMLADAVINDWEAAVDSIGRHAWASAAPLLVRDLSRMLRDLNLAITRHRSASALPRLVRAAAKVSGMMTLVLVRAGDPSWQGWAATARAAALEAGDQTTLAWVTACAATGHYCAGGLPPALRTARAALAATAGACGGTALAAVLETQILARTGDIAGAWSAFRSAERLFGQLGDEPGGVYPLIGTPALRAYHRGNFLLSANDSAAARELDLALELCRREDDYVVWAVARLRKAECLVRSGDPDSGVALAADALATLAPDEVHGIVTVRARGLLATLPPAHRETRTSRDFQAMLGPPASAGSRARS